MSFEFLTLGGYGQYVWPAFIFTFVFCLVLYMKSKKELQKQEKIFLDKYRQVHTVKIKVAEGEEIVKEALSRSLI